MKIFDVHVHVGDKFAWKEEAFSYLMSLGKRYEKRLYDDAGNQIDSELHNIMVEEEISHAIILPEYAPKIACLHPVERILKVSEKYDEFIPFGALNPHLLNT